MSESVPRPIVSRMIALPGLIDVHVHVRSPGHEYKEDWDTATQAALAGGITTILAMPNTSPAVVDPATFESAIQAAAAGARCDYGQYIGRASRNIDAAVGLKLYMNETYNNLYAGDMTAWLAQMQAHRGPIVVHAESRTMAAAILCAQLADRPIHIAHVSRAEEIAIIRAAKQHGMRVTCEVTPHHLFMTSGANVRPWLGSDTDRAARYKTVSCLGGRTSMLLTCSRQIMRHICERSMVIIPALLASRRCCRCC